MSDRQPSKIKVKRPRVNKKRSFGFMQGSIPRSYPPKVKGEGSWGGVTPTKSGEAKSSIRRARNCERPFISLFIRILIS